jgi:hypothetical protein
MNGILTPSSLGRPLNFRSSGQLACDRMVLQKREKIKGSRKKPLRCIGPLGYPKKANRTEIAIRTRATQSNWIRLGQFQPPTQPTGPITSCRNCLRNQLGE